jgi:hypothetical protein
MLFMAFRTTHPWENLRWLTTPSSTNCTTISRVAGV